ncbi:DNA helicase UvrD [Candidatus Beckwithbacteria bacterium CG10_big_fil_rev_8_21_14_0_10_34_10]|uniref:DNA helicase UvrD n=1 Tax=Candidatus Beckwithbacteria bacterium CG10_big_fil_rev_8_21_14_0_10_34_10 TaxID=1974495 RepID=A0A2H0W817_9BACT|nr:MAG: DNA helicase UvrD [Candidatus Beckwithbacteria bacterium CG10_big_fil_rev_8_21_14_0_10_34_10]
MKIIADLHLHSKYSRAVSQKMEPETLGLWAQKKGIDLLGTSDWTHPLWLKELESLLKEKEDGVYQLKKDNSKTSFILSTEISSIYSQGGKTRRIHNVVMAPSFKTVNKINKELKSKGCNLMSDGRPIIGLSSIELGELVWSIDEDVLIIPAHIWTPWFSMFGSKSGFDSVEECFGKFSDKIYGIETGLSSDPAMNWQIKDLDKRSILSFSDAHSPAKLGREATVFQSQTKKSFSFNDLTMAIKKDKKSRWKISYTIEFHPEEGKYHYTGHRNCQVRQSPKETKKKGTICPVCGKPLTLGVMHRVEDLAESKEIKVMEKENQVGLVGYYNQKDPQRPPYVMLVPLLEVLSESLGVGPNSKKVQTEYERLISVLAPELEILTKTSLDKIKEIAGDRVAEAIEKMRKSKIVIEPGFDGVFGTVKIWKNEKVIKLNKNLNKQEQTTLF